ncbi:Tripartite tricarboxylate transporter TctA family protein [Xaviernesmea oryzae]|uniref:Tripartite tricarboxylate transporter TctA family protein n=1 Tax=Xaviernesmea oryzae TaxID=464029 RepID=A0A1X7FPS2_9HYPH|nr:tripartite tricarboxylate transporter permease [Xaviernesmea oryzae]SMF56386.1 Tripartite tricarboxylate transporter TctA family protein [Xaviernesmea oryzae]
MEILSNLALGATVAFSPENLLYCFLGTLLGTFIGVLPGVGPVVTIAVLLPLTFGLSPEGALIMLAGIYYGAAYGGSTTAILMNLPGESSAAVTCLDGYQMARKGEAGKALAVAAIGSFIAGTIGTILIAAFAPPLTAVALDFGPAEYFSMILMAVIFSTILGQGSLLTGIAMAALGGLVGLAGTDVNSGVSRYTFGLSGLADGIDFAVVGMGLFAFTEIVRTLEEPEELERGTAPVGKIRLGLSDFRATLPSILRGSAIGSFFGILPGAGQVVSSFAAYMFEKKISKRPHEFGNGAIEGVAAPESANNAAAQTAFIPMLTLGIPGTATMALMLGAMLIQGITPGPQVMTQHPTLFWGLIVSMWIGNGMLVLLNLPLVGLWVKLLKVPYRWLCPAILMFSCIGIYSVNFNTTDIALAALFGVAGYVFLKLDCAPAPFVLGFILGPLMEENMRRAMLFSRGDLSIFATSPISAGFLAVTAVVLAAMAVPKIRKRKEEAIASE